MSFIYCAYSPALDRRSVAETRRHVVKFGFCADLGERLDCLRNGWKVDQRRGPSLALKADWDFLDHWPASSSTERRLFAALGERRHAFEILNAVTNEMVKAAAPGLGGELNGVGELRCFSHAVARDPYALLTHLGVRRGIVAAAISCACEHIAALKGPPRSQ